jgi:hypothetical protein
MLADRQRAGLNEISRVHLNEIGRVQPAQGT